MQGSNCPLKGIVSQRTLIMNLNFITRCTGTFRASQPRPCIWPISKMGEMTPLTYISCFVHVCGFHFDSCSPSLLQCCFRQALLTTCSHALLFKSLLAMCLNNSMYVTMIRAFYFNLKRDQPLSKLPSGLFL